MILNMTFTDQFNDEDLDIILPTVSQMKGLCIIQLGLARGYQNIDCGLTVFKICCAM